MKTATFVVALVLVLAVLQTTCSAAPTDQADTIPTQAREQEALRQSLEKSKSVIEAASKSRKVLALSAYSNVVATALQRLKQQGELDSYLAVEAEKSRFDAQKIVPEVADAPKRLSGAVAAYHKSIQEADAERDRRTCELLRRYVTSLNNLVPQLMKQDRISEAKETNAEADRAEKTITDLEAGLKASADSRKTAAAITTEQNELSSDNEKTQKDEGGSSAANRPSLSKLPSANKVGGVPKDVMQAIEEKAEAEHGTDFKMRKHFIDTQKDAYEKLQVLRKKHKPVPEDVFGAIFQKAETDQAGNYVMQHHDVATQMEAYGKLEAIKKNNGGVPKDVFEPLLQKAQTDQTGNYVMQVHDVSAQLEAYRNLKNAN